MNTTVPGRNGVIEQTENESRTQNFLYILTMIRICCYQFEFNYFLANYLLPTVIICDNQWAVPENFFVVGIEGAKCVSEGAKIQKFVEYG